MARSAPQVPPNAPSETPSSGRGCLPALLRLVWIFGGIGMIYCALFIAQGKAPGLSDALLPLLTLALIAVRFVDIRFFEGETLDNKPATLKHWRLYALKMIVGAAVLYAAAKIIAQKNLF